MRLRPMLAARDVDLARLIYPVLASPKIDGIRALVRSGQFLSRKLKPLPNKELQRWAKQYGRVIEGLDGELCWGKPNSPTLFNDTQSAVMSHDGDLSKITFSFFDDWRRGEQPYHEVLIGLVRRFESEKLPPWFVPLISREIHHPEDLMDYEERMVKRGFEGIMLRQPNGAYKFGRSTMREGHLVKMKRFLDAEATVIGVEPFYENTNEQTRDARGYSKRSKKQAGMVAHEKLGSLVVVTDKGIEFNIGSGFTDADRVALWGKRRGKQLIGQVVTYKHQPHGAKEKPRIPIFLHLRKD